MKRLIVIFLLFSGVLKAQDRFPKNYAVDVQHYAFDITLNDQTDSIKATAAITLLPKAAITSFSLDLLDNMNIMSVTEQGHPIPYRHVGNKLELKISLPAGQEHTYLVRYAGIPSTGLIIGKNKYGDRTFFSDNWPDKTRCWLPVIDQPYDKATCEFIVRAPEHYHIISNGTLVEESALGNGMKLTHWKENVPIPSWLYALGAADFAIQFPGPWRGKPIESWVYWQDRDLAFANFAIPTTQALDFYADYIGPFAYEKLANVEANSVDGASELATCIFYTPRAVAHKLFPYWRVGIAHEIAHHWFGNCVTEQNWDDVWLSEGFATYFSYMFIEHADGHDALIDQMKTTRQQVFEYDAQHKDERIVHDHLDDMKQVTSVLTYEKGAWVLHMLRTKIGDDAFRNGILAYYKDHFNGNATTSDLKNAMEQASGMKLDTFFTQWLYRGGNPKLDCAWSYSAKDKTLHLKIRQVQHDGFIFNLPVEIGIYDEGQDMPSIKAIQLNDLSAAFDIKLDHAPARIVIDPRTVLLAASKLHATL